MTAHLTPPLESLGPSYWYEGTPAAPIGSPQEDLFRIHQTQIPHSSRTVTPFQSRQLRLFHAQLMKQVFPGNDSAPNVLTVGETSISEQVVEAVTTGEIGEMVLGYDSTEGVISRDISLVRSAPVTVVSFEPLDGSGIRQGYRIATDMEADRLIGFLRIVQQQASNAAILGAQTESGDGSNAGPKPIQLSDYRRT